MPTTADFESWLAANDFPIVNFSGYETDPSNSIRQANAMADMQAFLTAYAKVYSPCPVYKRQVGSDNFEYEAYNGLFGMMLSLNIPAAAPTETLADSAPAAPADVAIPATWEIIDGLTGQSKLRALQASWAAAAAKQAALLAQANLTIQSLNSPTVVADLQAKLNAAEAGISVCSTALDTLTSVNIKLNAQLADLQPAPAPAQPTFIDSSKPAYVPYEQTLLENTSSPLGYTLSGYSLADPREVYAITRRVQDCMRAQNWPANLPSANYSKLMAIWTYILRSDVRTYIYKYGVNFQFAGETLDRAGGNCTDSSVLFTTLCRACGIPADRVFSAVGPTFFGYHDFPVVYLDDADVATANDSINVNVPGWYIFESTINGIPAHPQKLIGSGYYIDNGVANDEYEGQILPSNLADFGGPADNTALKASSKAAASNARGKTILHSSELLNQTPEQVHRIRMHWEGKGHVKN